MTIKELGEYLDGLSEKKIVRKNDEEGD
jgi:hypothetical protein